jgi:hypothetical protein
VGFVFEDEPDRPDIRVESMEPEPEPERAARARRVLALIFAALFAAALLTWVVVFSVSGSASM